MKLRVEPYQWIIKCITLYSLSTIIYGIVNDYLPLNTILGIILIILFGILYLKNLKKRDIYFFICVLFLFVFDNLVAIDKAASISDSVYWVFTLLAIWKVCDEETYKCLYMAIVKQSDFIKIIFTINNFILVGGLFLGNCYSKSWGSTYYVGFAYSNHVLASGACITLVMALYIFNDIKSIFLRVLILLPATIAILQSGARTYIVSIAVIWLIYFLYCFQKVNIKLFFIPFATIVISYIFINSGMMVKFINPNTYEQQTGIETFSSGRTVFWLIDLQAYWNLGFINKLFGNGFDFPYFVNRTLYKSSMNVWAHNDFINTLMTSGVLGIGLYLTIIRKIWKSLRNYTPFILSSLVWIYVVFVMFINGFFVYQHYLFSFILLFIWSVNNTKNKSLCNL